VFVATQPSELIQFRGEAQYAAIPGTELLYAVNTSGNVFKVLLLLACGRAKNFGDAVRR
jgi:hypothetical protein